MNTLNWRQDVASKVEKMEMSMWRYLLEWSGTPQVKGGERVSRKL